jgi:hypothetical protein
VVAKVASAICPYSDFGDLSVPPSEGAIFDLRRTS